MISICIPVFNFYVEKLVNELYAQVKQLGVPSEIILIDDGSHNIYKESNKELSDKARYIELEQNIGRAAIRNLFLKYAKYNHLLFLDCDSLVLREDFLAHYLHAVKNYPGSVICGGRVYNKIPPPRNKRLRWKYGIVKESKPAGVRRKNPYVSFMTNNFVVDKKVFELIKFDERLTEYGHEDTLFGFELKKKEIPLIHTDNPILNGHLEDNTVYIRNTEKAIANLASILKLSDYNKALIDDVTLLRAYYKFYKQRSIIALVFSIAKPLIKITLIKGVANLHLFDFYKLGTISKKVTLPGGRDMRVDT